MIFTFKPKSQYLTTSQPVTICDGIRPPYVAKLIGFDYHFYKQGNLGVWAKIQSKAFGEETVELSDVVKNYWKAIDNGE